MKRNIESDDDIDDDSFKEQNSWKSQTQSLSGFIPDTSFKHEIPWIEKYSPSLSQLCVNPSKVKQLRTSMEALLHNHKRLLIVTGPTGSGKSTSVKLLAKELCNGFVEYMEGNFDEFLNDCKYLVGKKLKFVIIENLPNIYHPQTLTNFRAIIDSWLYIDQALPPLIICLSEIETTFQSSRHEFFNIENNLNVNTVFGKLLRDPRVEIVKFNPIAKKFMLSTINKIISNEPIFKHISKFQLNRFLKIIEMGDIRSSINNLEFWSRFHIPNNTDIDYNRNSTLDLFHVIGKIIYSSSNYRHLSPQDANNRTVEEILGNYENLQLLHLNVLENYLNLLHEADWDTVKYISNNLSKSELIYDLDEGKDLMIRSTRHALDNKLANTNNFRQIKFTRNFDMMRQYNSVSKTIYNLKPQFHTSFNNLNLIDGCYIPLIRNRYNNTNIGRIGGKFKTVSDDLYQEDIVYFNGDFVTLQNDEDDDALSDPLDTDSDFERKKSPLPFEADYGFLDDDF